MAGKSQLTDLGDFSAQSDGRWRIELFGSCTASSGNIRVTKFPSRAAALLLARLALRPRGAHAREELIELLWPGVDLVTGRSRLRPTLSTLRHLLRAPGGDAGTVLAADRSTAWLNADAVSCDVAEFEQAAREGRVADARALYRGELLPGHYDGWVLEERRRLQAVFEALGDGGATDRNATGGTNLSMIRTPGRETPPSAPAFDGPGVAATVLAPSYLSLFVGREVELESCARLVAAHRLVTLAGTGGCGKTRLAIELSRASERLLPGFDTVVFVELADCRDAGQLADRLRIAMRLPGGSDVALELLAAHFAERRGLLVLDNFEQLVDIGGSEAVGRLLARLSSVHALVTSRRMLRVAGEREFHLLPFELPALDDGLAVASASPAVALFLDRARGVRADFHLTTANREDVLAVCRLLEGLPLSLEIAASRVRTYALREMRQALEEGYALVARGGAAGSVKPLRHASLYAAIAWSWRLLAPDMQAFLGALTVFRGGFDAAAVGAVADVRDPHVGLDALLRDSLLAVAPDRDDDAGYPLRFHLLDAVRDYVRGQVAPAQAAAARAAHRRHFLEQATEHAATYRTVPEALLGNYVEALRSGLEDCDVDATVALLVTLKTQWESVTTPTEVLRLMERVAVSDGVDSIPGISTFLSLHAIVLLLNGRPAAALESGARALRLAGDDPRRRAEALFAHTRVDWVLSREGPRVVEAAREAVRLARAAHAGATEASALSLLGAVTLWGLHDPVAAAQLYEQAEARYVAIGNRRGALQSWHGRMGCLFQTGRYEDTIQLGRRLEHAAAELGNVEARLVALDLTAESLAKLRRFDEALATAQLETRLARRHHRIYNLVYAVWHQGRCLARLRRPAEAGVLMGFGVRYWEDNLGPLGAEQRREAALVQRLVRAQLGAARAEALRLHGATLSTQEAIRRASGI